MALSLSVITVCRNAHATIADTIASVARSTKHEILVEYIVIDGASSDGTAAIVQEGYSNGTVTRWISESDVGIYNAMNKGLALASGEFCVFLNADDCFNPDAISQSLRTLAETNGDYVYADAEIRERQTGMTIRIHYGDEENIYFGHPYCHQTLVCRTDLIRDLGGFDEQYEICADHDLMWKLYRSSAKGVYLPKITVSFNDGGLSTQKFFKHEMLAIRQSNASCYVRRLSTDKYFPTACFREWEWQMSILPGVEDDNILIRHAELLFWFYNLFLPYGNIPKFARLKGSLLRTVLRRGVKAHNSAYVRRWLNVILELKSLPRRFFLTTHNS